MQPSEPQDIVEEPIGLASDSLLLPVLKKLTASAHHSAPDDESTGWPSFNQLFDRLKQLAAEKAVFSWAEIADLAGELIVAIDREIGRQLSIVMTHPCYTQLESAWHGLTDLVHALDAYSDDRVGSPCEVQMVDFTPYELARDLASDEQITRSRLFQLLYEERLDTRGGKPMGLLVSGMEFGALAWHSPLHEVVEGRYGCPTSISLLGRIAQVAEWAMCPFISSVSPGLFGLNDFSRIPDEDKLKIRSSEPGLDSDSSPNDQWKALRQESASRFLGLVAPRAVMAPSLSRRAEGIESNWFGWPAWTSSTTDQATVQLSFQPLLGSAAYALAGVVIRSVCRTGWPSGILGVAPQVPVRTSASPDVDGDIPDTGGLVIQRGDSFNTDPKGVSVRAPVECALTGEQERKLGDMGFLTLSRISHCDRAAFYTLRMVHQPDRDNDAEKNATQELHSILPYILTACRFAQFAKVYLRAEHGKFKSESEVQSELQNVFNNTFVGDRKPLIRAEVKVTDAMNGTYFCQMWISPRLMAEDVKIDGAIRFRLIVESDRKLPKTDTQS